MKNLKKDSAIEITFETFAKGDKPPLAPNFLHKSS
jgi:hypothetical protein